MLIMVNDQKLCEVDCLWIWNDERYSIKYVTGTRIRMADGWREDGDRMPGCGDADADDETAERAVPLRRGGRSNHSYAASCHLARPMGYRLASTLGLALDEGPTPQLQHKRFDLTPAVTATHNVGRNKRNAFTIPLSSTVSTLWI